MKQEKQFNGVLKKIVIDNGDFKFGVAIENYEVQRDNPTLCKQCGEGLIFGITRKGKNIPVQFRNGAWHAHFHKSL